MNRRKFIGAFSYGSLPVLGGVVLSSCESVTGGSEDANIDADLEIVKQAALFEVTGIKTYDVAAGSGLFVSTDVSQTAILFRNQHQEHLDSLNAFLTANSRAAVTNDQAEADSRVNAVTNQLEILQLAIDVEFTAATFYYSGINDKISSSAARKLFSDIFPIEVSHAVAYKLALGQVPAINAGLFQNITVV